jgi:non-heme chloroperoxidase
VRDTDFVETEILGRRLRYQPFDVRTPDGLRVCAQDWRSGKNGAHRGRDVLLIHGFSQSHLCWFKQLASPLIERYRFVTYDLRGHGGSDKPLSPEYYQDGTRWAGEVQAVIEAAGLVRPVIVAWSYGGRVALDYLQVAGTDAIAGLVMVAATSCIDRSLFGPVAPLLASMTAATDLARNIDATRRFLNECVAVPLPAADLELMLAYNLMVPPLVRAAMSGRAAPYETVLRSLNVAVLAIHGTQDGMVLPAMTHHTVRTCARAEALIYEGIGHVPFWEAPERFNADLATWLDALRS